MKKLFFFLTFFLLVGSCQKDQVDDILPLDKNMIVVNGTSKDIGFRDVSVPIKEIDRAELKKFYDAQPVDVQVDLTDNLGWDFTNPFSDPCSEWGLIVCNDGNVTSLDFSILPYITENQIEIIPSDWTLPELLELRLSDNNITEIPEGWYMPQLTNLYLENSKIEVIPENWSMPKLNFLLLNNNNIEFIPDGWSFPQLTYLGLSNNKVSAIPEGWSMPSLTTLDLSANNIESIPENWSMPSLTTLYLGLNGISIVPESWSMPALTTLGLSTNNIGVIPENWSMPSLATLNIENNIIETIPENWSMPSLTTLYLSRNNISCYPSLWSSVFCGTVSVFMHSNPMNYSYAEFCTTGVGVCVDTPETVLESLNAIVDDLLSNGVIGADDLNDKLTEIEAKIEKGKIKPAINQLNAFKNQVASMLNDGYIPQETADTLTDKADALIAMLKEL